MRKKFEVQYELGATPIENLSIPTRSRDEMPPVLRALQYIYTTPELNEKVFELLDSKVRRGKKQTGRPGMTLWEILVLATIRLTRDADYDHLHYMASTDNLIRGLLGVCRFGETKKEYSLQSIKDNVGLIDDETLAKINDLVVEAGHQLVKKKDEKLNVQIDSYVLESNVHFPTDVNLLYDAARKSLQFASRFAAEAQIPGWRKAEYHIKQFKSQSRLLGKLFYSRSKNKEEKLQEAAKDYLKLARKLLQKLNDAEAEFEESAKRCIKQEVLLLELKYYKGCLYKQTDLVQRRIIDGQTIPHSEKIFSLFEPYTEWLQRGKAGKGQELGLKLTIARDQFGFILIHELMQKQQDKDMAVPVAKTILEKYDIQSMSFDQGYWTPLNYRILCELVPDLVMPKKGKLNQEEYERQHSKTFIALRKQHSAVESAINSLEHHGLNRCPDKGLPHFKKYAALGILACNLHKLGNILQEAERKKTKNRSLRQAA